MTNPDHRFNDIAAKPEPRYAPPFSLRLTADERERLDVLRGSIPLGQYIREELLGKNAAPRKRRSRRPVKDQEALGRVLGTLGASHLSSNLNQLARAVNSGSLPVTPETEESLSEAFAAVVAMRQDLMRALGHKVEGEP